MDAWDNMRQGTVDRERKRREVVGLNSLRRSRLGRCRCARLAGACARVRAAAATLSFLGRRILRYSWRRSDRLMDPRHLVAATLFFRRLGERSARGLAGAREHHGRLNRDNGRQNPRQHVWTSTHRHIPQLPIVVQYNCIRNDDCGKEESPQVRCGQALADHGTRPVQSAKHRKPNVPLRQNPLPFVAGT